MCSESKGADQLRSYCEADLRLFLMRRLKFIVGFFELHLDKTSFPILCYFGFEFH